MGWTESAAPATSDTLATNWPSMAASFFNLPIGNEVPLLKTIAVSRNTQKVRIEPVKRNLVWHTHLVKQLTYSDQLF